MAARGSQHDQDEIVWQTAGIKLGSVGLDLRKPGTPGSLSKLLNARFTDDQSLEQRSGHRGVLVLDDGGLPQVGPDVIATGQWVYGHGQRLDGTVSAGWENAHLPIPGRGAGIFQFDGQDVVWTGDRLLVLQTDGAAFGLSQHWGRDPSSSAAKLSYGLPAYFPVQTDEESEPFWFANRFINAAFTSKYKVVASCGIGTLLRVRLFDRETGAMVFGPSDISGASNNPVECIAVNSNDVPVVVWRDGTSKSLYISNWTGAAWSAASVIDTDVVYWDLRPVANGFYLLWHTGSPSTAEILIGKYVGAVAQSTPFAFGTVLSIGATPNGPLSLAVAPDGRFGVLGNRAGGLYFRAFNASASVAANAVVVDAVGGPYDNGISLAVRGLKNSHGVYDFVAYRCVSSTTGVVITAITNAIAGGVMTSTVGATTTRFNAVIESHAFRVGDEVFIWLQATNSKTRFLLAGSGPVQVCGFADREEAIPFGDGPYDGDYYYYYVMPDPLNEHRFVWARPYFKGQEFYDNVSDVARVGELDFLAQPSFVQYGKSVYISGSAVRNYDGRDVGDAGWHDYPVCANPVQSTGGQLTTLGSYYWRVYPVRYNSKGERFQGVARTFGPVTLTGTNRTVALDITTVPCTNDQFGLLEIYRTEANGTTFYLEGILSNSLTAQLQTWFAIEADATLRLHSADPHAPGVGQLAAVQQFGPIGCSMLSVVGDRLWGAGGQVPAGIAQFSKLFEVGKGAGFDDLAGYQVVDIAGTGITSVHGQGDTVVVHQSGRINVLTGTGPDNYGRGAYVIPQITLADGAANHVGTILTPAGTVFWAKEGPRLITPNYTVANIGLPVLELAKKMTPVGVRANIARNEVVWYTADGNGLLWNYLGGNSRWAQWTGLPVTGTSPGALVTADGRVLYEEEDAEGDAGSGFPFSLRSGLLRAEDILQGATQLRGVGVVGAYKGPHDLRFRVYYNGSPFWGDEWTWQPEQDSYLLSGEDLSAMTPAQIDALAIADKSGGYTTHKRVSRHSCQYFQIEISNVEAVGPTFIPYELSIELGAKGGFARVAAGNFQG